jgi:hypothetical protein
VPVLGMQMHWRTLLAEGKGLGLVGGRSGRGQKLKPVPKMGWPLLYARARRVRLFLFGLLQQTRRHHVLHMTEQIIPTQHYFTGSRS